jgi:hypothetical protein
LLTGVLLPVAIRLGRKKFEEAKKRLEEKEKQTLLVRAPHSRRSLH